MTFKPIDAKRDEFRKYLERTGVLEAMSKVFIKLIHHPERPENAIDYICANMGSSLHQNDQIDNLQRDLDESKDEIAQLKQIIENLKSEKKTAVNELSIEQQQDSVEEFNDQHNLSDDTEMSENVENQMANCTIAPASNKEPSVKISTSNDATSANISTDEKNIEIKDNEPKKEVSIAEVTDSEICKKIEETVE